MAQVIIPWRGGDPQRERVRRFLMKRYKARFPSWGVVCGECVTETWSKAQAVIPALRNAPDDVVIVADADVWTDGLESAVRAITVGAAEWAVPHKIVYRLTKEATDELLTTNDPRRGRASALTTTPTGDVRALSNHFERRPYEGVAGGGIVVAHRDTLLEVPLDPRFRGIDAGHEDEAWGIALNTLKGPPWRGTADLIHLWHPPRPRLSHRRGSVESWEMLKHYLLANRDPQGIQVLIEGAHDALNSDVSPVLDRSPLAVGNDR